MEQSELEAINVNQLQQRCKSKKELYEFLSQDCGAYLPRIQSTNIYYFKDIIRGNKEVLQPQRIYIKRDSVKVSAIPHIEGLTVDDFIQYAKQNPLLLRFLPDERDWVHLDRQWVCDVLYTLDQEGVSLMVKKAQQVRKERLEKNRDLLVQMRPEFVQALNNCLNYSHEKGRSANLIKVSSKRKRPRSEIEEVKEEELQLKQNKHQYLIEVKRLKTQKENLEHEIELISQANEELAQIYGNQSEQQQVYEFQI